MKIGIPKEVKDNEYRVAGTPAVVEELVRHGHSVYVEAGAGIGSSIHDEQYEQAGAVIVADAQSVYDEAELIIKVKEPTKDELRFFRPGHILFAYLHLAPDRYTTMGLLEREVTAIAYETVQLPTGQLPLLIPMSEVAGRMAIQIGASYLERTKGGLGVLLGGIPGVEPAEVVVVGGGTVGAQAARVALGMGAHVKVIDSNVERLRYLEDVLQGRFQTLASNRYNIECVVRAADLVIGAVLIPGARAPHLVTEDMVQQMKAGSVIIDVAVDQGGCIETIDRTTTHERPIYVKHDVIHYAVPNIPGAVPHTATYGLTNATLPYIVQLANKGLKKAARENKALAKGFNLYRGQVVFEAVAKAHDLPFVALNDVLA